MRRTPSRASSAIGGVAGTASTLTGTSTASTTAEFLRRREPRRVDAVGAGVPVGDEPGDRVVEVVDAVEVVLRAARQYERRVERPGRLGGLGDALDGESDILDPPRDRVPVLDRAACRTRLARSLTVSGSRRVGGKQRSLSTLSGRSVAGASARRADEPPRVTWVSSLPSAQANPALVVASASKPSEERMRADRCPRGSASRRAPAARGARKRARRSAAETVTSSTLPGAGRDPSRSRGAPIADATTDGSIVPSSASAFSAATATW